MNRLSLKWEPLGRIFNPEEHILAHGVGNYAQGPQALVMDDRVRVFFSTRYQDIPSQFISYISYADFSLDFGSILDIASHQVLEPGGLGRFDEHGIFPVNILDRGGEVLGFTTGWSRRQSVPAESSIGLIKSSDGGRTFSRAHTGPIISANASEPFLVADGCAVEADGVFHMLYIFGTKWVLDPLSGQPERVYKIGAARSENLVHWDRDSRSVVTDVLGPNECQAFPTVFHSGGQFHMLFCYREHSDFRSNSSRSYRLGYASSRDLLEWRRDDQLGNPEFARADWDSDMRCYPNCFAVGEQVYMLYNGNHFGKSGFGLARLVEM